MHNNWEELIPYYVAGSLPKADTSRLESHLARCAECRKSLEEWRLIAGVVRADAASQMRDLPPLSEQVLQYAGQQAQGRYYQSLSQRPAPTRRYSPTTVTLLAAVFTIILFGGLLALMVLRGISPQNTNVALAPTASETPIASTATVSAAATTVSAATTTVPISPSPTAILATSTPKPQIIVIEPSETPVSPTFTVPTRIPPTAVLPPTRVQPTAVLPPTLLIPTFVPTATDATLTAQSFIVQAPTFNQECTLQAASSSPVGIYGGPGASYPTLATLTGDNQLTVLGATDNGWYRVQYPPGSELGAGWVQREQVYTTGNCDTLPLIPVASATPSPTPTETVLPFPTVSEATTPTPEATVSEATPPVS